MKYIWLTHSIAGVWGDTSGWGTDYDVTPDASEILFDSGDEMFRNQQEFNI